MEARDRVDLDGLASRVARVPVDADNYGGLGAAKGKLFYVRTGAGYLGRSSDVQPELFAYDLEKREGKSLAKGIGGLDLSRDGKKLLVREGRSFRLLDVGGGDAKTLSLAGLAVDRVPTEEWAQIFDEVWRRFRDFFYAPNTHGYDWEALREQYRPLLAHVGHRSDLNYVMSEMVAELNVSHAYVSGGDYETPSRPRAALLGARFELDEDAGRYRIAHIFEGQNEARNVLVDPIPSEDALIYLAWTERSRRIVAERGGGRIGYLACVIDEDTASDGDQFAYQFRRAGLGADRRQAKLGRRGRHLRPRAPDRRRRRQRARGRRRRS